MRKEQLKENQVLCHKCDGTGLETSSDGTKICLRCNGHGYLEMVKTSKIIEDAKAKAKTPIQTSDKPTPATQAPALAKEDPKLPPSTTGAGAGATKSEPTLK